MNRSTDVATQLLLPQLRSVKMTDSAALLVNKVLPHRRQGFDCGA